MVNRVSVPLETQVLQDSGAFSDGPRLRLSFEEALERQLQHAESFGYLDTDRKVVGYARQITHRASYDLLIDEKWEGGVRHKARWTEGDAEDAVRNTVEAARYLSQNRRGLHAVLSAQGVSPKQYLRCAEQIVPLLEPGDFFGLGGWCITGKFPAQMLPVFRETMHLVIPFLGREGVQHVHIWGVIFAKALGELLYLCDEYGIHLSTDSVGPSVRPCLGKWGYAEWHDKAYRNAPTESRGLERARHVQITRDWLDSFRGTKHYRPTPKWILEQPQQLSLLNIV